MNKKINNEIIFRTFKSYIINFLLMRCTRHSENRVNLRKLSIIIFRKIVKSLTKLITDRRVITCLRRHLLLQTHSRTCFILQK